MRVTLRELSLAGLSALLVGGCASPGPLALGYGVRHIPEGDWAAVLGSAETALANLGYPIDRMDASAGVITTCPVAEDSYATRARRPGTRLSSPGEMRRFAEVRLARAGDRLDLYCKVVVEELTTRAHRIFAQDHALVDTPDVTPIDGEAATTQQQNTVWRRVQRDKAAEHRILDAILKHAETSPG